MDAEPRGLPEAKQEFIEREFGDAGRDWIARFPALLDTCVERWGLALEYVAEAGWPTNVTCFARGPAGEPLVLKIGYPHPEQVTEMIALRHYAGHLTPRLVDADEALGATLMERILPGGTFRSDEHSIARSWVVLSLHRDLPRRLGRVPGLPHFEDWLSRAFTEFREKFPRTHVFNHHVEKAEAAYAELRGRHPQDWLLHGDLHHENILEDDERGWVAIDPKGVIGPKPMEFGRFLHNFPEDEIDGVNEFAEASIDQIADVLAVRVDTFARGLDLPRQDLLQANYVDAVLSFCWTLNSRPDYADFQPVDASLAIL